MQSFYDGPAVLDGLIRAEHGQLVDAHGRPLLLRGVGLGNWLLPEGYMWRFQPGPESPRAIEAYLADLVGPDRAAMFWAQFCSRFITETDIARIAAEGFNHVRLPINSRVVMDADGLLIDDGFRLVDELIEWCWAHRLWVVLDLHGAPGGQTGTNIDDSPNGRPELFESDRYWQQTVSLWRAIARRYHGEPVVAAYDLLNEPLPNEWQYRYPDRLVRLYRELTAAIREVDPDHVIMYEGTHWATNWDVFTEPWDANSALQFHKYWSPPDRPSIQQFIDTGRRLGLPIYMGEGGENNLEWLSVAFQLYEDHGIGWNFWPWKKIDTLTSPCSISPPDGWDAIRAAGGAWIRGEPTLLDPDDAWVTLLELLDRMHIDQCTYRPEIVNALFRRAPVTLPAWGFGFHGPGVSHDTHNPTPLAGLRSDDAVTIRHTSGRERGALDFEHTDGRPRTDDDRFDVVLDPGEWVEYEVTTGHLGCLEITVTLGSPRSAKVPTVLVDGTEIPQSTRVRPATNDPVYTVDVTAGRHRLCIIAVTPRTVLEGLDLALC